MTDDDVRPAGLPTAARVAVGIVLAGITLAAVGLLVFPYLMFPKNQPTSEPVVVTEGAAQVLADQLSFSMSDQEITDTVTRQGGAAVVELRHGADATTVLVSIPNSVVEPTTRACYRFTLPQHRDITYEETSGCPALPSP